MLHQMWAAFVLSTGRSIGQTTDRHQTDIGQTLDRHLSRQAKFYLVRCRHHQHCHDAPGLSVHQTHHQVGIWTWTCFHSSCLPWPAATLPPRLLYPLHHHKQQLLLPVEYAYSTLPIFLQKAVTGCVGLYKLLKIVNVLHSIAAVAVLREIRACIQGSGHGLRV